MSGISFSPSHPRAAQQIMKTSSYSPSSPVSAYFALRKNTRSSSCVILKTLGLRGRSARLVFQCSSGESGGPGFGESESKSVLDAFFLGKALVEAINERIESTVGELLSTFGRLQAEQQKQVLEFQEEVLERAKRQKEKAAHESLEAQGLIPKSSIATPETTDVSAVASPSPVSGVTPEISSLSSDPSTTTNGDPGNNDPSPEILNGD